MLASGRIASLSVISAFFLVGCDSHKGTVVSDELSAPITMTTERGSTEGISLTWPSVPMASSYALYRCEVPESVSQDLISSAPIENCGEPIGYTAETHYTDYPPYTAPQAYVYHLQACADIEGQYCGSVIASVAAAQAVAEELPQMTTNIGDDGRQVISGLKTTLHAFAQNATGEVVWNWSQESGPKVTLTDTEFAELTFTAPDVTENTLLSFELRTHDDNGPGRPSKVAVTVIPANNISVKVGTPSRVASSGDEVSLHASGSHDNLVHTWRQILPVSPETPETPETPEVTLIDPDTANPSFKVPEMPQGGALHFEVTVSDPLTGKSASARTSVGVQYEVPTPMPIQEPSQTPEQVPMPVPLAAPLLSPLQIAQPLKLPQTQQLVPVPNPVLVPPKIPPQALVLTAQPPEIATGGTDVFLSATASGGREPYQWEWEQTSGPDAIITNNTLAVTRVTVPTVTTAQTLTFRATVTDVEGKVRTAETVIQALLPPAASGGDTPVPITPLEPRMVVVNETVPVMYTQLKNVTVTQLAGPQLQISQQSDIAGSGTQVMVTAPLLKEHSAYATIDVVGYDKVGLPVRNIIPVLIMRPSLRAPAIEAPAQVLPPQEVPKQDDPLVIVGGTSGVIISEGATQALGVMAQGGKGSAAYRYKWTYLQESGDPDIDYSGEDSSRLELIAPAVDRPQLLRFHVEVTDGVQTSDRDVLVQVNDVADSFVVGAMAPMTVASGDKVKINAPQPIGGVVFSTSERYRYSIAQVSGLPNVTLSPLGDATGDQIRNWHFNAPILTPGADDAVLRFEFTSYDRVDNMVKTTQDIIVKAPPLTPLVPNISSPTSFALGTSLSLQGDATGGIPPYSYEWEVVPEVQAIAGKMAFSLPTLSESGQNPTITPVDVAERRVDVASYRLEVKLTVTDAAQRTAETTSEIVALVEPGRKGTEALVCGHINDREPCTDLALVLGMTEKCPDNKPYALNTITGRHGPDEYGRPDYIVEEYRDCADASTVYNLFILSGDKDNPLCRNFDPALHDTLQATDFTCHLACYGNGCNIDTIPPNATLIGPIGSDGYLTIGLPPLPNSQ